MSPAPHEAGGVGTCHLNAVKSAPPDEAALADRQQQGWHATLNSAACEQVDSASPFGSERRQSKRGPLEGGVTPTSKSNWSKPSHELPASELDHMQLVTCAAVQPGAHDLLLFKAKFGGTIGTILIDSGASMPFLSETMAVQLGFTPLPADPVRVALPNGMEYVCNRVVELPIRIGSYYDKVMFRLIPLEASFDAVLGTSWLAQHNPHIDWRKGTVELRHQNRHVAFRRSPTPVNMPGILSAMQLVRAMRQGCPLFAAIPEIIEDESGQTPPRVQRLLAKYAEVFEDPKGMPPKRDVEHAIL